MPYPALFQPLVIKGLTIRNRFLSTSHAPAYTEGGRITERYIRYHAEKAKGGVGLTQFGGATTVSVENSFHYGQVNGSTDDVVPQYRAMSDAIHEHGAACTVQLTHGGRRERWDEVNWLPAFSSSCTRELVHGSFAVAMEDHDMRRVLADYAAAAHRVREGGVDGVEISCQAGTLIEQFWSPAMNRREDDYGGSLVNRMRFGLEVLAAVRRAVGDDYVVGIRMPGDEMMKDGLAQADCVAIARAYAASGLVDFVSVVGGQGSTPKDEARIWPTLWVPSAAYLELARAIKQAVDIPIFHATRITDAATAEHAVRNGYLDMVGMTRAFIADPYHVRKLRERREAEIRPCVGAGYCVDRVISGHDALCVHNVAAGRETRLAQVVSRSDGPRRKVVVVGGGPGGMEAARVSAERGHEVVLFEATGALGGQLALAARATWRRGLGGIVGWLGERLETLGVDLRFNRLAEADDVLAESPDVVVVATGGLPNVGWFSGSELATSTWDVLAGDAACEGEVLVFDENGSHAALSTAEVAADAGARVTIVTPHRSVGTELGGTSVGAHLAELYRRGIRIVPDTRLAALERRDNRLAATLANLYSDAVETRVVDRVVGDHGTLPNDDLYRALKPLSINLGELDLRALADFRPPAPERNVEGAFVLFRIGDAWTSRNVHAAMLDAMRCCKDL
ncbi:MAG: NADH:flavin oxidoreductase [Planctomycetes bacterium]|nr:NADH:flavin oxidoreductase [Planctomycetota bacterium]